MKMPNPYQDVELRALLKRVSARDKNAFRELYQALYAALARHLLRLTGNPADVEELINDVMWVVWEKAEQFRGESQVSTWVLSIATLKSFRWRQRQPPLSYPFDESESVQEQTWLDEGGLARGLSALSPEHSETLQFSYYFGYSCEEIAALMQCPVGTVKTRLFYARKQLKTIIGNEVMENARSN